MTQPPAEVVGYLGDEDWRVRVFAARALAQTRGPDSEIADVARSRLEIEDDDWVANHSRWAMRRHG